MYYSLASQLALILNLIVNRGALRNIWTKSGADRREQRALIRYSWFIIASNCYFAADVAWGYFEAHHENPALFPIFYLVTVFYFIFQFWTMLAWLRYIVAYLDKRGRRSKILLYSAWTFFVIGLIYLMINRFHHFIFSFNENNEYVPEAGRHIAFLLQIGLYLVASTYLLSIANKSKGEEKTRYNAVGFACVVMEIGLIVQILCPYYPSYPMSLIVGICVVHLFIEGGERKEKELYDSIARGLADDYAAMYYIDIESGEYQEFAISQEYEDLGVPTSGRDFYAETAENVEKFVYKDDKEMAINLHKKETMIQNLEGRSTFSYKYRVMMGEEPRFFLFTIKRATDGKHFILYEKDIQKDIDAEAKRRESQKKEVTFTQIAEGLAANYDVLYYVNVEDSSYISFECRNIYGQLYATRSGDDYFADTIDDVHQIVYSLDQNYVLDFLNRDHFISSFTDKKSESIEYRIMAGPVMHHVRTTIRKTSDGKHYIVGIENIDEEIQKEKQHLKALNTEKELARRDELTGVKNKTAYTELEKSIQEDIDSGIEATPFAIVVCDTNNLKKINDTEGHKAGDEYIRTSAKLLCNIFSHSPVFRVGGDEFVVFLRGSDYSNRENLMNKLRGEIKENLRTGTGPILASGMAEFVAESDTHVLEVFDRADKEMYDNKQALKSQEKS